MLISWIKNTMESMGLKEKTKLSIVLIVRRSDPLILVVFLEL